jgi:hypothetical protein
LWWLWTGRAADLVKAELAYRQAIVVLMSLIGKL